LLYQLIGDKMYKYRVDVTRVVDGDTVDVDIDLGFGMVYKKQRVRLYGIDTPESRTKDLVEKKYGKAAKKFLQEKIESAEVVTLYSHDKGKFGRILGELFIDGSSDLSLNQLMINNFHAVAYHGQSKEEIEEQHLANREKVTIND
jgi:micrococcal nuclease